MTVIGGGVIACEYATIFAALGVQVNEYFQTSCPHIYAVGDLIGQPGLAFVGMEQGRLAALHALGRLGQSECELKAAGTDYVRGTGRYNETARGQIIGDAKGFLKLLVCPESRQLLGIHVIGESAS